MTPAESYGLSRRIVRASSGRFRINMPRCGRSPCNQTSPSAHLDVAALA